MRFRFLTIGLAGAAALVVVAGTASARATVGTFYNHETITAPDVSDNSRSMFRPTVTGRWRGRPTSVRSRSRSTATE
jgi:hypothetical protein